jgi:hypothetical protein
LADRYRRRVRNRVKKRDSASELPAVLTAKEAAALLGIAPRTVMRACQRGAVPGAFMFANAWAIPRSGVAALQAAMRPELATRTEKGRVRQRRPYLLLGGATAG